ncbi:Transcription antiterminator BglG family [Lactiplantibacillus plantarum]|nr:Transcription antiterminator BglG family [Lactiplantibacillus plantarum]
MAPNSSPATLTRMIIELILSKRIVHYQDIMEYTGTSRKTIAKYLNEVEKVVNQQGVHLVRKRGQGIRFSGNTKGLLAEFPILKDNSQSEQERRISIMTFLTQQSKPVLLDDIADHFFISRSTLERDLNVLKMDYGLKLTATTEGVKFNSSESDVRRVIGQLLQSYWGQEIKQNQQTGKMTRTFKVPQSLKRYVRNCLRSLKDA